TADTLQQRERDRRIVDEGPVAARARELASNEELARLERDAGLVEHDQSGAPRSWLEHGLDRGRLRLRPDQVGLRPDAAEEENRVDHARVPGCGMACDTFAAGSACYVGRFDRR